MQISKIVLDSVIASTCNKVISYKPFDAFVQYALVCMNLKTRPRDAYSHAEIGRSTSNDVGISLECLKCAALGPAS